MFSGGIERVHCERNRLIYSTGNSNLPSTFTYLHKVFSQLLHLPETKNQSNIFISLQNMTWHHRVWKMRFFIQSLSMTPADKYIFNFGGGSVIRTP